MRGDEHESVLSMECPSTVPIQASGGAAHDSLSRTLRSLHRVATASSVRTFPLLPTHVVVVVVVVDSLLRLSRLIYRCV